MLGSDGLLAVPSAPGPAFVDEGVEPAAFQQLRLASLSLTCIAGLGGLPQVCISVDEGCTRSGASLDTVWADNAFDVDVLLRMQVSLPIALVDGAPVGLSFIGPPGSDEELLRVAVELAAVLQQQQQQPAGQ